MAANKKILTHELLRKTQMACPRILAGKSDETLRSIATIISYKKLTSRLDESSCSVTARQKTW